MSDTGRAGSPVVRLQGISKRYHLWSSPQARLVAPLLSRLARTPFTPAALAGRWQRAAAAAARPFFALRNVGLEVGRGEAVGIVGRNGSGKSTLLQIVAGTVAPSSGTVGVDGRVAALLELGSGFNPDFTGRENVQLNAAILGLTPTEVESRFGAITEFAQIGEFIDQPVKTYSSGMYLRLAFAVAANVDAEVLIVDEALAVGDEAFQRKCFAWIQAFQARGGTLLFVSHSAAAVVELCDRAVLLDQGELLMCGVPKQVVACYQRLLYAASPAAAERLRQRLRDGDGVAAAPEPLRAEPPRGEQDEPEPDAAGSYDPGLRPQSTLAYDTLGAEIRAARLTTRDGRPVNVLQQRGEYAYEFEVDFAADCSGVRFGMMTKTVTGFEIGGAVSCAPASAIREVRAGAVARVRFRFRCLLAPGTYFLNAGVLGLVDGAEQFLHRVIDLLMFRVGPEPGSLMTGPVDLQVRPEVAFEPGEGPQRP